MSPATTYPIAEHIQEAEQAAARLKQIDKEMSAVSQSKAKLQEQEDALRAEAEELTGYGVSFPGKTQKRRGRKPGKASNKTKAVHTKKKAAAKKSTKKRGRSKSGQSREDLILRVLPTKKEGAVGKEDLNAMLEKAGYKSEAANPIPGIGQALNRLKKLGFVENASRGMWNLTKSGVKERDAKINAAAEAAESASK